MIKTKPRSTLVWKEPICYIVYEHILDLSFWLIQYVFLHNAAHGFLPSRPGSHGGFVYICHCAYLFGTETKIQGKLGSECKPVHIKFHLTTWYLSLCYINGGHHGVERVHFNDCNWYPIVSFVTFNCRFYLCLWRKYFLMLLVSMVSSLRPSTVEHWGIIIQHPYLTTLHLI